MNLEYLYLLTDIYLEQYTTLFIGRLGFENSLILFCREIQSPSTLGILGVLKYFFFVEIAQVGTCSMLLTSFILSFRFIFSVQIMLKDHQINPKDLLKEGKNEPLGGVGGKNSTR